MRQTIKTGLNEAVVIIDDADALVLEFQQSGQAVAARLLTPERAQAIADALTIGAERADKAWQRLAAMS